MYQPFQRAKLDDIPRVLWLQEIVEHIRSQVETQPYSIDPARFAELPQPAQAIYFLWMFFAEVGGNGIECFLLDQLGHSTPQTLEALKLIGAVELVERLEAAIPHALAANCAEFKFGSNLDWFKQFKPNPKFPTLQSVDFNIEKYVGDDFCEKTADFIEAHRTVLLQ